MATELAFVVAIVSMNLLLGTLCLAIARGDRESPALRFWGLGLLVYTLGLLMNVSYFVFHWHVLPVVGYSLIAWASVISVKGVLTHTRYHLDRRWIGMAVGLVVVLVAYNHFGPTFRPMIDFATPTVLAILLFVISAVLLLKALPPDAKKAARFAAFAMFFGATVWTCRLLFLAGVFGSQEGSLGKFTIDVLAIGHIVASVACTFALFSIEVRKMESALTRVAFSDALTNLPNRRATQERFQQEMARANRHGQSFALVVIDIDHFKRVNDNHGHLAGDALLKHIVSVLESAKRAEDILGRIGGEEFVLLLVDPAISAAMSAAERLRQKVEASSLEYNGKRLSATVSIGLAAYPSDGADWDSVFSSADQRLYQSKRAGRNRVTGLTAMMF
jgi:diguanylate cyclase (GGDEF)-like protein